MQGTGLYTFQRLVLFIAVALLVGGCPKSSRVSDQSAAHQVPQDPDAALDYYERGLKANPNSADYKIQVSQARWEACQLHFQRGQAARLQGKLQTALGELQRALEVPAVNLTDLSERYNEWLRRSPYPKLIRGVYILEPSKAGSVLQDVIPGQPTTIRSTDWQRDFSELASPAGPTATSSGVGPVNVQLFSQGELVRTWGVPGPGVVIDGNPALIVPFMPDVGRVARRTVTRVAGVVPPLFRQRN